MAIQRQEMKNLSLTNNDGNIIIKTKILGDASAVAYSILMAIGGQNTVV